MSSMKISDGIAALKAATNWPKETITPAFDDEANTVYLNVYPKKQRKLRTTSYGDLVLPHPLSPNRRVVAVGTNLYLTRERGKLSRQLRKQGVQERIEFVWQLKNASDKELEEIVANYDTHILNNESLQHSYKTLSKMLDEKSKFFIKRSTSSPNPKRNGSMIINTSALMSHQKMDGFFIRVGHTGLTDQQLQENIDCAITFALSHDCVTHYGLGGIKLLQIKTGTSEGITVLDDSEVGEESTPVLPRQVVVDAIAKMKAAANWPEETKTPAFDSESDSVYLNILSKKITSWQNLPYGKIPLQHPLSMNRKVCYIGADVDSEEQQAEMTQKIRDQGVVGKIKIVPQDLVDTVVSSEDHSPLQELAQLYDMYLVDRLCTDILKMLQGLMEDEKKLMTIVDDGGLCVPWEMTVVWVNPRKNGLYVKVGHSGLTDQQLQENIADAVSSLRHISVFRNQLEDIKLIQVKTGTTEGFTIYQDDTIRERPSELLAEVRPPFVTDSMIADNITKLIASPEWLKETKTPGVLLFSSVKLTVFSKKMTLFPKVDYGVRRLPRPLSMNRRVCYIGVDVKRKEQRAKMTQKLKDQGVVGQIKIIPRGRVEKALEENDETALQELLKLYDTFLVDVRCEFVLTTLQDLMAEKKILVTAVEEDGEISLGDTALLVNPLVYGFEIKVGCIGDPERELQENITAAVSLLGYRKFFPYELDDIKLIQIQWGANGRATVYEDFKIVKIADGIAELKSNSTDWPEEPEYDGPASTVILEVVPHEMRGGSGIFQKIRLPHPLSLDRSVCYITGKELTEKFQTEMTQKLRDAGVLGEIKIIPHGLLDMAVSEGDDEYLADLAILYDTHLVDEYTDATDEAMPTLLQRKRCFFKTTDTDLGLDRTVMWLNSNETAFFIKVGHSGLSDKQLEENIESVVEEIVKVDRRNNFPDGLGSVKSIQILTGTTPGVVIYPYAASENEEAPAETENSNGVETYDAPTLSAENSVHENETDSEAMLSDSPATTPPSAKKAGSKRKIVPSDTPGGVVKKRKAKKPT